MTRLKRDRGNYEWMLNLSAEGWAWEFLRRNSRYQRDFALFRNEDELSASSAASRWGLLRFVDPALDAREAVVFWNPFLNKAVLPVVTAGEGKGGLADVKCKVDILGDVTTQRHVLYSCCGRFLQLMVTGKGDLSRARLLVDALPDRSNDRKLIALRRLADLSKHKRLRPELYGRQRRGPRFTHLIQVLDSFAKDPRHRSIARDVFGFEKAEEGWDGLRDHVRRALAAGRSLSTHGYLKLLG